MNWSEARNLISDDVKELEKKIALTPYDQGRLDAFCRCLDLLDTALEDSFVIGEWYWVVPRNKKTGKYEVKYLKLVKYDWTKGNKYGYYYFSDMNVKLKEVRVRSKQIVCYFPDNHIGLSKIYRNKEYAEAYAKKRNEEKDKI